MLSDGGWNDGGAREAVSDIRWVDKTTFVDLDDFKPDEGPRINGLLMIAEETASYVPYMWIPRSRAVLLPESAPDGRRRERLWFCSLNGFRFAVVDINPDQALFAVDEAWRSM